VYIRIQILRTDLSQKLDSLAGPEGSSIRDYRPGRSSKKTAVAINFLPFSYFVDLENAAVG
jgi:hypothetical protein